MGATRLASGCFQQPRLASGHFSASASRTPINPRFQQLNNITHLTLLNLYHLPMKKALFTLLGLLFTYAAMGQTPQATSNNHSNTTSVYQDAPATPHEVAIQNANPQPPSEPLSLWYTTPATNWVREALPIGNGDMGAMILGGVAQDRIQFNHKTL